MGVSANVSGPATLKFRVRNARHAESQIEWLNPRGDQKGEKPQSIAYTLDGGDWQEVTVDIPATGALGILRLHFPVQQESIELNWVELQGFGTKRRWSF